MIKHHIFLEIRELGVKLRWKSHECHLRVDEL